MFTLFICVSPPYLSTILAPTLDHIGSFADSRRSYFGAYVGCNYCPDVGVYVGSDVDAYVSACVGSCFGLTCFTRSA